MPAASRRLRRRPSSPPPPKRRPAGHPAMRARGGARQVPSPDRAAQPSLLARLRASRWRGVSSAEQHGRKSPGSRRGSRTRCRIAKRSKRRERRCVLACRRKRRELLHLSGGGGMGLRGEVGVGGIKRRRGWMRCGGAMKEL